MHCTILSNIIKYLPIFQKIDLYKICSECPVLQFQICFILIKHSVFFLTVKQNCATGKRCDAQNVFKYASDSALY